MRGFSVEKNARIKNKRFTGKVKWNIECFGICFILLSICKAYYTIANECIDTVKQSMKQTNTQNPKPFETHTQKNHSIEVDILICHFHTHTHTIRKVSSSFQLIVWPLCEIIRHSFCKRIFFSKWPQLSMSPSTTFPFLLHRCIRFNLVFLLMMFCFFFYAMHLIVNAEHCMQNCISFSGAPCIRLHFGCYVIAQNHCSIVISLRDIIVKKKIQHNHQINEPT